MKKWIKREGEHFVTTRDVNLPQDERSDVISWEYMMPKGHRITKVDGKLWRFGGSDLSPKRAGIIEPHLEPAPFAIGQLFYTRATVILAGLVELGLVSKDQIESVVDHLETNDVDLDELCDKHWMHRFNS